jgi:hypothetical protein
VDDDSLRLLAQKRADLVRDYLEDVAGVPRERLFPDSATDSSRFCQQ